VIGNIQELVCFGIRVRSVVSTSIQMTMMKSNTNRIRLGELGEALFCLLEKCERSDDPFDSEKDAVDANGKTVEIKTQARYRYKNMFTIRAKMTNINNA
jgi:hypothetical protein